MDQVKTSLLLLMGMLMLLTACGNGADEASDDDETQRAPVTVSVDDFSMSVESFAPRRVSQSAASYSGVKAITLAFYDNNNTEVYKSTQLRADNTGYITFGEFSCSLPIGSYTMVVLGYGSERAMTLTGKNDATFTNDRVRETFVYSQAVNIINTSVVNLSATLSRVVAQLAVYSTDHRPASATQVRMSFSAGGAGVNPVTGLATTSSGFSNTVPISTKVGATTGSGSFLFLNSDEQTMTVTVDVLNEAGNVLFTRVISDVPLRRNRVTNLRGSLYSSASSSFTLESSWLDEVNISF
jgi:hypothetical protein